MSGLQIYTPIPNHQPQKLLLAQHKTQAQKSHSPPYLCPVHKYALLFLALAIGACNNSNTQNTTAKLQAGDLLFQDLNCGDLCNAIEAVTEGVNGRDFSHCAMVVTVADSLAVVEAIGDTVQINSIAKFIARSGDSNIVAARVKPNLQKLLPAASTFALAQVGKPYDDIFNIADDNYYCSELIYKAFKQANAGKDVFALYPMTFKDPNTKNFFPAWVNYYQELKCAIPEGAPGLNPGGISRDSNLTVLAKFSY
ncbi:MAG: hypothetical protein RL660_571 [Bacteroidota bacterium]